MHVERFSPGVRPQERERREADLDRLAEQEVGLAQGLERSGRQDAARLAELFALASSTAEVRAAAPAVDQVDRQTLQRILAGQL
ncbi:MAG: hypothetical protein AAB558_00820 [Patescibacteria group bacterium]